MLTPPPLAWLNGFIHSIVGALGSGVSFSVNKTINPLVMRIKLSFQEPVAGKNLVLVWNLFQMYASKNDCIPQGKASEGDRSLITDVVIKRRIGIPVNKHPLDK